VTKLRELILLAKSLRDDQAQVLYTLARARRVAKNPRQVVSLTVPGLNYPISLRAGGPDYFTFHQIFVNLQYQHGLPIDPSFIIDAGANIGLAAILFAKQYPKAQIFSIEPDGENFRILVDNTAPYPNVRCFKAAVWPTESPLEIANPDADNPAAYTVRAADPASRGPLPGLTPFSLLRLANRERIDIFKIDIEGAELELFSNDCDQWLSRTTLLLVELHDAQRPGCGEAFFRSICRERFTYFQRSETSIVHFDRTSRP